MTYMYLSGFIHPLNSQSFAPLNQSSPVAAVHQSYVHFSVVVSFCSFFTEALLDPHQLRFYPLFPRPRLRLRLVGVHELADRLCWDWRDVGRWVKVEVLDAY